MRSKSLALMTGIIFLVVSSACSHSPGKPPLPDPREELSSQKEIARSLSSPKNDESWWKKDENQWLLAALIILGVGIATSASIWIFYNANGLTINIHK
jgi:hypothetical protein